MTSQRDAFFYSLLEHARKDKDIIALTVDMHTWALDEWKKEIPDQYINVGIAEQNAINVAAGLAYEGKKPFILSIASFIIFRAFEQIRTNICINSLPVCIVGVGMGSDYIKAGETHCPIGDEIVIGSLPGIRILDALEPDEVGVLVDDILKDFKPTYVRTRRGS